MFAFQKFTLARQFLLVSFLILLFGMIVIGLSISQQIKTGVMNQTSAVTALYVDSFISPILQTLATDNQLSPPQLQKLDELLDVSALGQQIVAFKIWSSDGEIIYSPNQEIIGKRYTVEDDLLNAFSGAVNSELTNLDRPEHEFERQFWEQLIETYAPIREDNSGEVIAVSEFYQLPINLNDQIRQAQIQSWIVVIVSTVAMYLLLAGMFGKASNTILKQQADLREKVEQLTILLENNKNLNIRVRRAASRTTALNEQFLHRISSDLHDGPIQDLALVMLRMGSLGNAYDRATVNADNGAKKLNNFETVTSAIDSAIKEIRNISAGLRIPELENLSPSDVARRAIRDYEHRTRNIVEVEIGELPDKASTPINITIYRVLQEGLTNGYRHANGAGQKIHLWSKNYQICFTISDNGPGFDPGSALDSSQLGLTGMRERIEILGGEFSIRSDHGRGTTIYASLPLEGIPLD